MNNGEEDHEIVRQQNALYSWQKNQREEYIRQLNNERFAFLSEFTHYISNLSADDAAFLKRVIESVGDVALQAEMCGILMGYLAFSKGRTLDGKDPDAELRAMLEAEAKDAETTVSLKEMTKGDLRGAFVLPEEPEEVGVSVEHEGGVDYTRMLPNLHPDMLQYNVQNREAQDLGWVGVVCKNNQCGMNWSSLEHRMENLDCPGCIEITKWGHRR